MYPTYLHLELNQIKIIFYLKNLILQGCKCIVKGNIRHRYIGFAVKPADKKVHIDRSEMIKEIRKQCNHLFKKDCKEMGIRLIRFDGVNGILKCNHIEKENAIELLQSIHEIVSQEVKVSTTATSGTIRALVKKTYCGLITQSFNSKTK